MAQTRHIVHGAVLPSVVETSALGCALAPVDPHLLLYDDFTGPTLDTTIWTALDYANEGNPSSGSGLDVFAPANATIATSILSLAATYSAGGVTGKQSMQNWGDAQTTATFNYQTAQVVTAQSLEFTYGTIEVRAKMSGVAGVISALWLLGAGCGGPIKRTSYNTGPAQWPSDPLQSAEVDIVEILGNSPTTGRWASHVNTVANNDRQSNTTTSITDASTAFHTYKLVWTPTTLTWYFDGAQQYQITDVTYVPQSPMFFLMDTNVGGATSWEGTPSSPGAGFPTAMQVDWVKITQP